MNRKYWGIAICFPRSSKAKRTVDDKSYNPNGKLESTFVGGIDLTFSY